MTGEKYNHRLRYETRTIGKGWTQDDKGHLIPASVGEPRVIERKCRMEVENRWERTVLTEDGSYRKETAKIYLPLHSISPEDAPMEGTEILITSNSVKVGEGRVLLFYPSRFNQIIWI